MTAALTRARALLDTPPPTAIPGQLTTDHQENPMTDRPAPAAFPALAVACPTCQSPAGALCTSHNGTRIRRHDVHQTRTAAHAATRTADCTTWLVTPETIAAVDDAVDQYGVYAKGFFEQVDGRTTVVGLRVGTGETRVVARFGDTLVRHPNGRWSVRPAAA